MSRPCSACGDARRPDLDKALVSGEPCLALARKFAPLSRDAIRRHRPHVGAAIVRASERKGERREESLLQKIAGLEADARRLGRQAEKDGDTRAALVAVDKLLDVIRLMHELTPRVEDGPQIIQIVNVPDWQNYGKPSVVVVNAGTPPPIESIE